MTNQTICRFENGPNGQLDAALPLVLRRKPANYHRFLGQIDAALRVIDKELVVFMKHPVNHDPIAERV